MAAKRRSQRQAKGRHRKNSQPHARAHWLQVGAVTVGLTAAVTAGQGVAFAAPDDGGSTAGASADSGDSTGSAPAGKSAKSPNHTRKQPSRTDGATGSAADDTAAASSTTRKRERRLAQPNPDAAQAGTADDTGTSPHHDASAADGVPTGTIAPNRHTVRPDTQTLPKQVSVDTSVVTDTEAPITPSAVVTASDSETTVLADPEPLQTLSAPAPEVTTPPETATAILTAATSTLFDTGLPTGAPLAASALLVLGGAVRRELDQLDEISQTHAPQGITTAAPNTPPTAHLAYVTSPGWLTGNVYGDVNASDRDWDWLHYSATDGAKGTVKINWLGQFTYTAGAAARHAAAAAGATAADKQDTFTVTVSDGRGGTATVDVTVKIKPANTNPRARVATVNNPVPDTGVVTGTVTATDRDSDPLSFSGPESTRKGTISVASDGTFTYTPTEAARQAAKSIFARSDSFKITVTDAHGGTDTVTVYVKITPPPANHAPTNGSVTKNPATANGVVTGTVTATDPDNNLLSYTGSTTTTKGSVVVDTDGTFTYTPTAVARHSAAADNASTTGADKDTFTVTVSDGKGGTLTVTVPIDISPANDAPEITSATSNPPDADGKVTGQVTATDADNDALTYSGTQTTTKGSVTVSAAGSFTYTPTEQARQDAASTEGPDTDTFTVAVTDGHGGTDSQEITVTIAPADVDHATMTTVDGSPIRGVFVGSTGYGYQFAVQANTTTGEAHTTIVVIDPDGNFTTTQEIPGLPGFVATGVDLGDFDYLPVNRPDGGIVYFSYDSVGPPGTTRVVQVATDGTVTYLHTGTGAGLPTHTDDGTLYQATVQVKTIVVDGVPSQVPTIEIWRLTPDGQFSTHSPDLTDQQYASVAGDPRQTVTLASDGTLYVPFTVYGVPSGGGVMAVHPTGDAVIYADASLLAVSDDSTAYLAIPTETGVKIVVVDSAGSSTDVESLSLGEGVITGSGVAGNHGLVMWSDGGVGKVSVIDSAGGASTYSLSLNDFVSAPDGSAYGLTPDGSVVYFGPSGVPQTLAVGSPIGGVVGVAPDGTAYFATNDGQSIVTVKAGVATTYPLDAIPYNPDDGGIQFAANGTAFALFVGDDGGVQLGTLTGTTRSTSVPTPGPDDKLSFTVIGNTGYLIVSEAGGTGTYLRALDSAGNEVIARTLPSSTNTPAPPIAVGPDGTVYLALSQVDTTGETPTAVVHIWAVDGDSATEILASDGLPTGLTVSPGGDLWVTLADLGDGTVVTTKVIALPLDTTGHSLLSVATIPVGDTPVGVAVAAGSEKLYVANMIDATVSVIDTAGNTVVDTINGVGDKPIDVATSPDGSRAYVLSQTSNGTFTTDGIGTLAIVDTANDTVVKTVEVGHRPVAMTVSPDGTRIYVANEEPDSTDGSGTVTVISTATNTVLTTLTVGYAPAGLAVSPDGSQLYLTNLGATSDDVQSRLTIIDTASLDVVTNIQVGLNANHIAVSPDGAHLYITDWSQHTLWVVDTATNAVTGSVAGPTEHVAISSDGKYVYAVQGGGGPNGDVAAIAVIDTATNEVVTTAALALPWDLALSADGTRLYAASYIPGTVTAYRVLDGSVAV